MIEVATTTAPIAQVDPSAPIEGTAHTVEAAKSARYAATTGAPATPVAEPAKPAATAEIAMTPEALTAATALAKETRETKAKLKDLEARATAAEPLIKAKELAAAGKHREAMAALGIDLNAAVAEELAGPGAAAELTPEQQALADMAAKLAALEEADKGRSEKDKAADAAKHAEVRAADVKSVTDFVGKDPAKYAYLSRNPAWVAEAYEGAITAHDTLVAEHKRELTGEEKHNLVLAALAQAEEDHAAKAKLYGANRPNDKTGPPPSKPSARPTTFTRDMRGGTVTPTVKNRTQMTVSEAKRARREASS